MELSTSKKLDNRLAVAKTTKVSLVQYKEQIISRYNYKTRISCILILVGLCGLFGGVSEASPPRVALVVGNLKYPSDSGWGPLRNSVQDARRMARVLKELGFEIIFMTNANRTQLFSAVSKLEGKLNQTRKIGGLGFVYYSGHGASASDAGHYKNYLLPVDIAGTKEIDIIRDGLSVEGIISRLSQTQARASFVVIDACRDLYKGRGALASTKGFRTPAVRNANVLVAFAAAPFGTTRDDGIYSRLLSQELRRPQPVLIAFSLAAQNLLKARGDGHMPMIVPGADVSICLRGCRPQPRRLSSRSRQQKVSRKPVCPEGQVLYQGQCIPKPPMGMRYIPGGSFVMGCQPADGMCDDNERPHKVDTAPFFMDQTEVTAVAYARCVASGKCTPAMSGGTCNYQNRRRLRHPINCVTWRQAHAYCRAYGKRLPTEAEWERAARARPGDLYPWGRKPPTRQDAHFGQAFGAGTVGVRRKRAGAYGLFGMAGNVGEWVDGCINPSVGSSSQSANGCRGLRHVLRGGSFGDTPQFLRSSFRVGAKPNDWSWQHGFRCAVSRP